jgi:hypothetical protein
MAERPGEQEQEAHHQDRQDHHTGRAAETAPGGRELRQPDNQHQQAGELCAVQAEALGQHSVNLSLALRTQPTSLPRGSGGDPAPTSHQEPIIWCRGRDLNPHALASKAF